MRSPWHSLENVPAHSAAAADWELHLDDAYPAAREAFLQKAKRKASSVQCPHVEGCTHELKPRGNGFVGKCKDDAEPGCDDIMLTADEAEVWEVNLKRLGAAIAGALKCVVKDEKLELDRTRQIASLGTAPPLPILLTVQQDADGFGNVVARLVARWPNGFVLLAPTSRFCTATATDMLSRVNAGFFDLETHVELRESGKLHAPKTGAELFAELLAVHASRRTGIERPTARYVFRKAGSHWDVVFDGGELFHLNDSLGAKYLDHLFHHPNEPIHARDLEAQVNPDKQPRGKTAFENKSAPETVALYRKRLAEIVVERRDAEAGGDIAKCQALTEEAQEIEGELSHGVSQTDAGEQARNNVRKAIGAVTSRLKIGDKNEKALGQHIGRCVNLGYEINYNQPEGRIWN